MHLIHEVLDMKGAWFLAKWEWKCGLMTQSHRCAVLPIGDHQQLALDR